MIIDNKKLLPPTPLVRINKPGSYAATRHLSWVPGQFLFRVCVKVMYFLSHHFFTFLITLSLQSIQIEKI